MGYGAIELGQLNMQKGKFDVAFDILFDCAVNDQNDDAVFLMSKILFTKIFGATKPKDHQFTLSAKIFCVSILFIGLPF
jgi:preprotein translocase subunit SecB